MCRLTRERARLGVGSAEPACFSIFPSVRCLPRLAIRSRPAAVAPPPSQTSILSTTSNSWRTCNSFSIPSRIPVQAHVKWQRCWGCAPKSGFKTPTIGEVQRCRFFPALQDSAACRPVGLSPSPASAPPRARRSAVSNSGSCSGNTVRKSMRNRCAAIVPMTGGEP